MNICGVLVQAAPAKLDEVISALAGLPGVEVHQSQGDGRVVVTVEDTEGEPAIDTLRTLHRLDGVVAASLVYHHFDADTDGVPDTLQGRNP